jgi:hypothetical protein
VGASDEGIFFGTCAITQYLLKEYASYMCPEMKAMIAELNKAIRIKLYRDVQYHMPPFRLIDRMLS